MPSGPKSFSDELRRLPIDYQRRVKWTFRIAAAWTASVAIGAGVFLLSKPYMDRKREEKIKSGEFFSEIRDKEKEYSHIQRSWNKQAHLSEELSPPPYLVDAIGQILKEENQEAPITS